MTKLPKATTKNKELPEVTTENKPLPEETETQKEMPIIGHEENMVQFGKKLIEIKPTKIKYQRDHTAALYYILKQMPVMQFLSLPDDFFKKTGDDRTPDKMLFDWLIALTDDVNLVVENYNELDASLIEKCLEIFCRLNKIEDEKKGQAQMITG